MRQEAFFDLTWETVQLILDHKELRYKVHMCNCRVPTEGFVPSILEKLKFIEIQERDQITPYLDPVRYKSNPKDIVGSMIVCFFADGTEKYNEVNGYVIE